MIDKAKITPPCVRIADQALRPHFRSNPPGMITRSVKSGGSTEVAIYKFVVDNHAIAGLTAFKALDGSWWVRSLEANFPAALHGHNGRPLQTAEDLHLALTRIRNSFREVVTPETLNNLIPLGNHLSPGFIRNLEAFAQFDDHQRRILKASHVARQTNQQKPTGVFYDQSSAWYKKERKTHLYSKADQMPYGRRHPKNSEPVRFEIAFRDPERLAAAIIDTGEFSGTSGPRCACLSPGTVRGLVQQGLQSLTGFGWRPDECSLKSLSKVSRLLILAAGESVFEPHMLDKILTDYEAHEKPGDKTMRKVSVEVRSWVHDQILGPRSRSPIDLYSLPPAEVRWPRREDEFARLMAEFGAPDVPDPDIAEAWSETRFLKTVPRDVEMVGSIMPSRPAFPTGTI